MKFPRLIKLACPYCGHVYARSLSGLNLGPGVRRCAHCKRTFADGSVEWPRASHAVKLEYLFPAVLRAYFVAGLLFGAAFAFTAWPYWHDILVIAIWEAGIMSLSSLMYWISCAIQIRLSVVRHRRRMLADAGYREDPAGTWVK